MAPETERSASDIPRGGWVDRALPRAARPYARLARFDRSIGSWLLLFPCWWAIAFATPTPVSWEFLRLFALFGIGAVVMRGAGCTYNDICDREFDAQVARTRDRPLPAGEVTVVQAALFMAVLLAGGFAVLISFNHYAVWVGIASLALVFTYPLMKRVTFWPQFFLGLAFNWGALLGWAAVRGEITLAPLLLYVGGIAWTLGYDTIYAHQDKVDDAIIGIKSSARRLGEKTRPALWLFYGTAIILFGLAGWQAELNKWFYFVLVAAAIQLSWQATTVDIHNPVDCLKKFRSNTWFGWIVFAAGVLG